MKKLYVLVFLFLAKFSLAQNDATNIISVDPVQFYFKTFSISYEKLINENKQGVRITNAFGKNYYEIGGDFKFYLANFGETNFQVGGLDLGVGEFRVFAGPSLLFIKTPATGLVVAPRATGGISWDFSKGLYLMLATYGGLGIDVKAPGPGTYADFWLISGAGYRF